MNGIPIGCFGAPIENWSADVAGLIQKVTETVQEKFGVTLEPEVIFLGDFEK